MIAPVAPAMPDASSSTPPSGDAAAGRLPSPAAIATPSHRRLAMLADRADHFSREADQLVEASASIGEWNELLLLVQRGIGAPIEQLRAAVADPMVDRDLGRARVELLGLFVLVATFALGRPCDIADAPGILEEVASWLYTAAGHSAP